MLTAKHKLEFKSGKRSAKKIVEAGTQPEEPTPVRLPRITKMMALAIRLDHLIKSGQASDQAELARVGHVSRARLTQILDLTMLAPDIQEEILDLKHFRETKRFPREIDVRQIAASHCWRTQRNRWRDVINAFRSACNLTSLSDTWRVLRI